MTYKPAYQFILVWKNQDSLSCNRCFINEIDAVMFAHLIREQATNVYLYFPDGQCRNFSLPQTDGLPVYLCQ